MQQEFRLSHADAYLRPCAGCGQQTGEVWAHLWSDRQRSGYTEYHVCGEACARAAAESAAPRASLRLLSVLNGGARA